jgi:hypothetical protein
MPESCLLSPWRFLSKQNIIFRLWQSLSVFTNICLNVTLLTFMKQVDCSLHYKCHYTSSITGDDILHTCNKQDNFHKMDCFSKGMYLMYLAWLERTVSNLIMHTMFTREIRTQVSSPNKTVLKQKNVRFIPYIVKHKSKECTSLCKCILWVFWACNKQNLFQTRKFFVSCRASCLIRPSTLRMEAHVLLEGRTSSGLHDVTYQKTAIFKFMFIFSWK